MEGRKERKGKAVRKAKDRQTGKEGTAEGVGCVCTLAKTAISADMFMEWTKRSKDHGEEEAENTEGMSRSRRHPCVACGQSGT